MNDFQDKNLKGKPAPYSRTVRNIGYAAVQNLSLRSGNLLVFVILARFLVPESFGLVAITMVYIALLQVFLEQGFVQATIRKIASLIGAYELGKELPIYGPRRR